LYNPGIRRYGSLRLYKFGIRHDGSIRLYKFGIRRDGVVPEDKQNSRCLVLIRHGKHNPQRHNDTAYPLDKCCTHCYNNAHHRNRFRLPNAFPALFHNNILCLPNGNFVTCNNSFEDIPAHMHLLRNYQIYNSNCCRSGCIAILHLFVESYKKYTRLDMLLWFSFYNSSR
jgi:hypothetical protein